jgi:hypothetical protein
MELEKDKLHSKSEKEKPSEMSTLKSNNFGGKNMDYREAKEEVTDTITTIKLIIEHGFNNGDDSLGNMDRILMQINRQVISGRELIKKLSDIERMRGMQE